MLKVSMELLSIMNTRFVIQRYKINEHIITYKVYNDEIINWYSRINKVIKSNDKIKYKVVE